MKPKFKELDKIVILREGEERGKIGIVMSIHKNWQGSLHGPYEVRLFDSNSNDNGDYPRYLMREEEIDYPKNALQRLKDRYET